MTDRLGNIGRRHQLSWAGLALLVAALGSCCLVTAAAPDDDPPVVRRVLLRPDQLAAELERVQRGVLRQLPRDEFENLVGLAADVQDDLHHPPRLLEARYRATLTDDALTGSAEWTMRHTGPRPALLSVDPLQLAVRSAAWADGPAAMLADLDRRPQAPGLELLIDRPGERTLKLEWSARGRAEPGRLHFDLRVPPCPIAILELDLPADREPGVPREGGLLTGPFPAAAPDRRLWRLVFGHGSQVDLSIRSPAGPDQPAPLVLAAQRNRQELTPGQVSCEFIFDLDVPHAGVRELFIECDPTLRPTEVAVRNLERWGVQPGATPAAPTTVHTVFREPFQGGPLTLRAFAAIPTDGPWVSPEAHVVGAVPRGESLTLRVHPDVRLLDWRAGAFRLADSAVATDHWQTLTLQTGLTRAAAGRPAARLQLTGPEYYVRERLWWQADADRMTMTADLDFDVARGPVFQVPLRLPAGWQIERVEAEPADRLAAWSAPPLGAPDAAPSLLVEFQPPLTPANTARLQLLLRRHCETVEATERVMPFPDVLPLAARGREGTLAVRVGPAFRALANTVLTPAAASTDAETPASWGDAPADDWYTFRSPAIAGTLQLVPRAAHFHARGTSTVTVTDRRVSVTHRLRLEPISGADERFLLHTTAAQPDLDWRVVNGANRVRSAQALDFGVAPLLMTVEPWSSLAAAGLPRTVGGSWWVVTLAQPLTEPIELEAASDRPLPVGTSGGEYTVPLLTVAGANGQDRRLTLDLRSAPHWQAASRGLSDVPDQAGSPRRKVYSLGAGPVELLLMHTDTPAATAAEFDGARLTTYATDPGRLVHHLSFRLLGWTATRVPLDLPSSAVVRVARVNGAAVRAEVAATTGHLHAVLPTPAEADALNVDVVYTTPTVHGGPLTCYAAEAPSLPAPGTLKRVWCLPDGAMPLAVGRWRLLPDVVATDEVEPLVPPDLGERGAFWGLTDAHEDGSAVWTARPTDASLAGAVLAVAALALAWVARAWNARARWAGLFIWSGLAVIALICLPGPLRDLARWPLFAALLTIGWALLPLRSAGTTPEIREAKALLACLVVCLSPGLLVSWPPGLFGAAPAPVLVYLVPGTADAPEPRSVLAPPGLLDQLRAAARRGAAGLAGVVATEASYEGQVADGQAHFQATIHVHSFSPEPAVLALPFGGVQLRAATIDGAPAFPRAAGDVYHLAVPGPGAHTLGLSFTVPYTSTGNDRELRFTVPELANSRLTLQAPAGATHLQALTGRGSQHVADGPQLEAELGRTGAILVRWRSEGSTARPAIVRTREAYLWDLTESAARLHGTIRFTVARESATTLAVDVPKELAVASVSARPFDPPTTGGVAPWLTAWRLLPAPNSARLVLEFSAPITGQWQVALELVPREPFAPTFALPFPTAVGLRLQAALAWRARGVELAEARVAGVSRMAPDAFVRDFGIPMLAGADTRPPTRAYSRAVAGMAPVVRLSLTKSARPTAATEITWHVSPGRAEVEAIARVRAAGKTALVEWDVPAGVTVEDVRGPDIHTWTHTGTRLQVWLRRSLAEAVVQWTGSAERPADLSDFMVPVVGPRGVAVTGTLSVIAQPRWSLAPTEVRQLEVTEPTEPGEWLYKIVQPTYLATFHVRPAGGGN